MSPGIKYFFFLKQTCFSCEARRAGTGRFILRTKNGRLTRKGYLPNTLREILQLVKARRS